ncbi:hypothetical protein ACFPK9_03490 [Rubritalea spongiae]|uniref:DUF4381 domain-containing protein n=1 Tax=Rubritalea spongiae TaxID=430797 RepID=A0ABW5E558_9BACT
MPEFHDIIETSEKVPLLVWWQWVLLSLAALAVILLLIFILKKSRKSNAQTTSNLELALQKIQALELKSTDSNRLATDLSVIVREYLQMQFEDRALFETDEEFHERSHHIEALPEQAAEKLRQYLTGLSQHKYAPSHNHPAALESYATKAAELLKGIDSTIPRPLTSG